MKRFIKYLLVAVILAGPALMQGCKEDVHNWPDLAPPIEDNGGGTGGGEEIPPVGDKEIYIPSALKSNDFDNDNSQWSYLRSRQSENFIVFWESGFGEDPASAENVQDNSDFDADDVLLVAERAFSYYSDRMKFITRGSSKTDQYKMLIFINYDHTWLATGSGYDDTIGAMWLNGAGHSPVRPCGQSLSHEVGHAFQYQVHCDDPSADGFMYGFGTDGAGGNGFWETTANWQAYTIHAGQQFTDGNYQTYISMNHLNVLHEDPRYENYYLLDYWTHKYGIDFVGRIWRESRYPEDPVEAYQRLTGMNQSEFNDDIWEYAARMVTWDVDPIRSYGAAYMGRDQANVSRNGDGYWQIQPDGCIENYGYNVLTMDILDFAGGTVTADFKGLAGAAGYRAVNVAKAGWRYGFVAMRSDGTRLYSEMGSDAEGTVSFDCPAGVSRLCFVVSGAPTEHWRHPWDDDPSNDEQWPYQVLFTGADLSGGEPRSIEQSFDVYLNFTNNWDGAVTVQTADILCQAFNLTLAELASKSSQENSGEIKYYPITNGVLNTWTAGTTNPPLTGHYFDANGNVEGVYWDTGGPIYYSYYDTQYYTCNFVIAPRAGSGGSGQSYQCQQAIVYDYEVGKRVQATFTFNVHFN